MGNLFLMSEVFSASDNFGLNAEIDTEEYTKYLNENNVIDGITKALCDLYETENKPSNPIRFIIDSMMDKETRDQMQAKDDELQNLKAQIVNLENENKQLKENIVNNAENKDIVVNDAPQEENS